MIAIVDYGRGNLGSVEKAFARIGMPAVVTQDPKVVDDAEAVVLPGDGAFHDAMGSLQALGLIAPLRACFESARPFLGICLGYQLLFSESEEFGQGKGLDVIPGAVRRFPTGLKVPHMGWNQVGHRGDLPLSTGSRAGRTSTSCTPTTRRPPTPRSGSRPAPTGSRSRRPSRAAPSTPRQFHPEKSQRWGIRMLENFAAIVRDSR